MKLLKIGRDSSCDIVLHSNKVSALHAELTVLDTGELIIEDKRSSNGTTINGRMLEPSSPHTIRRGDRIRLADIELPWSQVPQPEDNSLYKEVYGVGTNSRNKIRLENKTVSRFHATIKVDKKNKYFIVDHSKNGTTINGKQLTKNVLTQFNPLKDKLVVGGIQLDLQKYITIDKGFNWKKLAAIAASLLVLCGIGFGAYKYFNQESHAVKEFIPATSMVVGQYHYVVKFKNDPFLAACEKYNLKDEHGKAIWPTKFIIGTDGHTPSKLGLMAVVPNNLYFSELKGETCSPLNFTGTAFFVSKDGKLITNKHVAYPWRFLSSENEKEIISMMGEIREKIMPLEPFRSDRDIQIFIDANNGLGKQIVLALIYKGGASREFINSCINDFKKCEIEISGEYDDLRIAQANHNYNSTDELLPVSVSDTLPNPEVDLALLQLNTKITPSEVSLIIDPYKAITDTKKLDPMAETFYYLGYPLGFSLNLNNKEKGLLPRLNDLKIARTMDRIELEFQGETFGGASGSPVIDKNGRLIAVINKGLETTQLTRGVQAKYVVDLFKQSELNH